MNFDTTASQNLSLIILAAGIGNRYGGLKQIEPIGPNNELLIDYSIYDALKAGFGKIVFVLNKEIDELFRKRIGQRIEKYCDVKYVYQDLHNVPLELNINNIERKKPWGTAHATLSTEDLINTPFVVINADDYYGRHAFKLMASFLKSVHSEKSYCMLGFKISDVLSEYGHVSRGICKLNSARELVDIDEHTQIKRVGDTIQSFDKDQERWSRLSVKSVASMNIWGFTPAIFSELNTQCEVFFQKNIENLEHAEYYLPDVVKEAVIHKRANVKVIPTNDKWLGITYPQDRERVKMGINSLVLNGYYPEFLWER